jgi:uncharacterized membrane protein
MTALFRVLANLCLAGFLFLLPVFVAFQIVSRAWTALGSFAVRITHIVGAKNILGVETQTAFTGLLLVLLCILCGSLVHFSLVRAFHDFVERQLAKYIPGYEGRKAAAEGKVHKPAKVLPYTSALVMQAGLWRPGYVIEQDAAGNAVVFLPDIPNTDQGHVLLAAENQIQLLRSVSANQLDATLKKLGKGLLSEHSAARMTNQAAQL